MKFSWIIACGLSGCLSQAVRAEDWRGFLGSTGNAYIAGAQLPKEFSAASGDQAAKNIAWKTEIAGRAVSGPIVVGDRVFTTTSSGVESRWCEVICVDGKSGQVVWTRKIKTTGRPYCHPTSANAAPTPCSDGQHIFAFFSSNDLVCYDLDGNLKWYRGLAFDNPKAGNDVGMSSSPVVVGGVVVVQSECQGDSFAMGIDARSGSTLWQMERPHKPNWASPRVAQGADGQQVVLLQSSTDLAAVDPRSGSEVWKVQQKCSTVPSAVATNGRFYLPAGNLKAYDLPKGLEAPQRAWESSRVTPDNSSVVITDKAVLSVKGSVLSAVDFEGKLLWQVRLGELGQVWASPIVAGNTLFVFGIKGKCVAVDLAAPEAKVIATSELGEEVLGTPAVMGNGLVVRSVRSLWKIAAQ